MIVSGCSSRPSYAKNAAMHVASNISPVAASAVLEKFQSNRVMRNIFVIPACLDR